MSGIDYSRCSNDDFKAGTAEIGENPDTGQPVELNINGVASVVAIQSALLTVSAALKSGHEEDFMEKISLCLFEKLTDDPHALCPLFVICSMCLLLLTQQVGITFNEEGRVVIASPDVVMEPKLTCMFDDDDDDEGKSPEVEGVGSDGINP